MGSQVLCSGICLIATATPLRRGFFVDYRCEVNVRFGSEADAPYVR